MEGALDILNTVPMTLLVEVMVNLIAKTEAAEDVKQFISRQETRCGLKSEML